MRLTKETFYCCRSAAKEAAAGDNCRRVTFYEIDQLIYNTLKFPFYHLDLIGIQRVRVPLFAFLLTTAQSMPPSVQGNLQGLADRLNTVVLGCTWAKHDDHTLSILMLHK